MLEKLHHINYFTSQKIFYLLTKITLRFYKRLRFDYCMKQDNRKSIDMKIRSIDKMFMVTYPLNYL